MSKSENQYNNLLKVALDGLNSYQNEQTKVLNSALSTQKKQVKTSQITWKGLVNAILGDTINLRNTLAKQVEKYSKTLANSIFSSSTASDSIFSTGLGGLAQTLFFDTGGIVPGKFNQSVPAVVHGSEMVLNPGQQANLFKMINSGQTQENASNQIVINMSPNFSSLDPQASQKIFNEWYKQTIQKLPQAIKDDKNGLRKTIRAV